MILAMNSDDVPMKTHRCDEDFALMLRRAFPEISRQEIDQVGWDDGMMGICG
jgi:hypothetical protein